MVTKEKEKDYKNFDKFDFIDENSIILDFGANVGDVTHYLYDKFKSNIHCYEPNISCFNYLQKRFAGNKKITIYNLGVSNFSGSANLYFHKESKGTNDINYFEGASYRIEKDNLDVNKKITTKVINIKEVLNNFTNIDLIKIDIEGSEYLIMPEIIKNINKIKKVVCETHGNPQKLKYFKNENNQIELKSKNKKFSNEYNALISELKYKKLYSSWFIEWH